MMSGANGTFRGGHLEQLDAGQLLEQLAAT
jgi:hypothetical protein